MKKILLSSAFALIGIFAMANNHVVDENIVEDDIHINSEEEEINNCGNWIKVFVECGSNFFLCGDGKSSETLAAEADHFASMRCLN